MEKEYPFQGMPFEQIIEITFKESGKAILGRGENAFIGFSFIENGGPRKNFVGPKIEKAEELGPVLKKLQGILEAFVKEESRLITSPGWFIRSENDPRGLDPNHTTYFQ